MSQADLSAFIARQRANNRSSSQPLQAKRVLDLSSVIAAPFAAALLGDAGAEVIKVENPKASDPLRGWGDSATGVEPYHAVIGRHKFPVTLNLKSEAGRKLFTELLQCSDVLIENMRVGAMERLGLSVEALLRINPGLIIAKVTGFGTTGPSSHKPGFGTIAESYSGYSYLNGDLGGAPRCPPIALADMTTGVHLAYAISLALHGQKRGVSGGQLIDVSLFEPLFSMMGGEFLNYQLTGERPEPVGNELPAAAPRNVYQSADGQWIALSCSSQNTFETFATAIGQAHLIDDPRFVTNAQRIQSDNRAALNEIIAAWFESKTEAQIMSMVEEFGITAGPVATMDYIDNDAHYNARRSIVEIEDPATGQTLRIPNVPFRMQGVELRFTGLPPGSANAEIYGNLLGYQAQALEKMREDGAI